LSVENAASLPRSINQLNRDLEAVKILESSEIDANVASFLTLLDIMKEVKVYNLNLSQKILRKIENQSTLSGDDLYQIKKGFEVFSKAANLILEAGKSYETKGHVMSKTYASRLKNPYLIKGHALWLLSNLTVMESIEAVHKLLYLNDDSFRRIFKSTFSANLISPKEAESLTALTDLVSRVSQTLSSRKFQQQVILVRTIVDEIKRSVANNPSTLSLYQEIEENRLSKEISEGRKEFSLNLFMFEDSIVRLLNRATNLLSGFFGNAAGSIKWRKGFLYENREVLNHLKATLNPMDIILEKSYFTATDKFIPGHYGHVALYLGTKAQLEEIGMWNHPKIVPYQKDIEEGKTILEAVRPGVRLSSVEDFSNIDEYTIIRKNENFDSYVQYYEQISRGMQQIGKPYDFNFDISTLNKIVCSELIYIVFGNVNWPTLYRLGRPTITPDDIAEILFRKNTPFKMTEYVASNERQKSVKVGLLEMADLFDYELRAWNGSELKDKSDPSNSFWKKDTKCYRVFSEGHKSDSEDLGKKVCKTSYKEYVYEEQGRQ
ncbi:MAG: hypothetical protein K2Q18_02505, partial [Bdellovibrionales bacterium]|nr:hypothetical protein [Bdellovibrionales bacterium]